MCPWIVFGKTLTANTQFLWPKLLASRWVDDRYSESVLKAYSESVGGARNKFRDDRVACNMFEARLLIFVLKKFSLFLYENLRRLIQLPKPKSAEWMILEWSRFALDEYSLSVLNVSKPLTFPFWSRGQRLVRVALSETRKKRLMHLPGGNQLEPVNWQVSNLHFGAAWSSSPRESILVPRWGQG